MALENGRFYSGNHNLFAEIKESYSCVDFLNSRGIRCQHSKTICAPDFIRHDHNPSFTVYHNGAHDWATGENYSVIDLCMLADKCSLEEAVLTLSGVDIHKHSQDNNAHISYSQNLRELQRDIENWAAAILEDPVIEVKGEKLHLVSEYLAKRGFDMETCRRFQIGYNKFYNQVIFPHTRNNKTLYYTARDMSGKSSRRFFKPSLTQANHFGYENIVCGLNTLRDPQKKRVDARFDSDGNVFYDYSQNIRDYSLVLCEGGFDWLSFANDGWQVLTANGGHFSHYQLPYLISLASRYDRVILCFDNDDAGKKFQRDLALKLVKNRIKVYLAHIPSPDGKKYDVNDFYANGGKLESIMKKADPALPALAVSYDNLEEFYAFLEQSLRFCNPLDIAAMKKAVRAKAKMEEKIAEDDPEYEPVFERDVINYLFAEAAKTAPEKTIAEEVIKTHPVIYKYDDSFFEYKLGHWERICDTIIFGYASDALGKKATAGKCRAIVQHVKAMAGSYAKFDTQHVFAFRNGVLDLNTGDFYRKGNHPIEVFKNFMNTAFVTYDYDVHATCGQWESFIKTVTRGNKKLMKQLQKAAGYVLYSDNRLQKMFALYGSGANGKSTFTQALEAVFGEANCSHVRPDRLDGPFDGIHLEGKLLNICYEAKRNLNGAEETLKAAASGDSYMAAHKGVDAISITPRAKWFINLNDVMETTDVSWGFLRRLIFLPFSVTISDKQADKDLQAKLLAELPGIFNWVYAGYKMLMEEQGFEDVEEGTRILEAMMARSDNVFAFFCESARYNINDFLTGNEDNRYPRDKEFFQWYKAFCVDNNTKPCSQKMFREKFRALLLKYRPDVVISAPQKVDDYRGKISTFYFPEIIPQVDPDYFEDTRDVINQKFSDLAAKQESEYSAKSEQILAEEAIEEIAGIVENDDDAEKKLDVQDFALETLDVFETANQQYKNEVKGVSEPIESLMDKGRGIFGQAYKMEKIGNNRDWPSLLKLSEGDWVALYYYLLHYSHGTRDKIHFDEKYDEFMKNRR